MLSAGQRPLELADSLLPAKASPPAASVEALAPQLRGMTEAALGASRIANGGRQMRRPWPPRAQLEGRRQSHSACKALSLPRRQGAASKAAPKHAGPPQYPRLPLLARIALSCQLAPALAMRLARPCSRDAMRAQPWRARLRRHSPL